MILSAGEDAKHLQLSYIDGGNEKNGTATLESKVKTVWQFLIQLNIHLLKHMTQQSHS